MKSRRALILELGALGACASGLAMPSPARGQTPRLRPADHPAPATSLPAPGPEVRQVTQGRVVIMRGLGNIFSRGMDEMAQRLLAYGIPSIVENHIKWRDIAARLIEEYKADPKSVEPIIIIGHSLGGDAGIVMSNYLGLNGVPVRLLVVFDAVAQTHPVIWSIHEVINYYKPKGYGQEVDPGKGFSGTIANIDLTKRRDIGHLNIDKNVTLQNEVIAKVLQIYGLAPTANGD